MRYVALLRSVNVGGKNILKMEDLRSLFHQMKFSEVTSYIQSGNILFESDPFYPEELEKNIEQQIQAQFRKEIMVMVRSVKAIENLIGQNPFEQYQKIPEIKLYVSFLKSRPGEVPPLPIISIKDGLEIIQVNDQYAFVTSRKVRRMYGFPNNLVEKELNIPATTRNWNTLLKMTQK